MITNKIEDYIQTITTFEFKAYEQNHKDYLYDASTQQCCDYIWKKYPSASFKKMTVFNLKNETITHIDSKVLRETPNIYALGTEEDMNKFTLKRKKDIEDFKKKHNA